MSPQPRRGPRGGGGLSPGGWAPQLTPRTAVRIAILGAIVMSLLGLLLVRLWFLQVISGEDYAAAAESNRLRTVITEAPRGNILDRNGDVLVANRPGKNVVVHPRDLTGSRREEVLSRLAPKLHLPLGELIKKVDAGDSRPLEPVVLAENVDPEALLLPRPAAPAVPGGRAGGHVPAHLSAGRPRGPRPGPGGEDQR